MKISPLPRAAHAQPALLTWALTWTFALACCATMCGCPADRSPHRPSDKSADAAAPSAPPAPAPAADNIAAPAKPAAPQYHCPMHPQVVSDRPGDCPICNMQLVTVPVEDPPATAHNHPPPTKTPPALPADLVPVTLDGARLGQIGLKTAVAQQQTFGGQLRTAGRFTFDETRVHHIHTRFEAYVEQVFADFTGKYVRRGEPLLSLYSPDLYAAEQEYLIALQSSRGAPLGSMAGGGASLLASARQKLLLWNVPAGDIRALERGGQPSRTVRIYAPSSGYIVAKTAVHGMRVKPEDSLFDIVDLSRLWVLADAYEYELPRLSIGQTADITVPYWPGRSWPGRITYIYPSIDPQTRTVRVRLEVDNPQNTLKSEMLATVAIHVGSRQALVIPDDAVIETGTRKLVFVIDPTPDGATRLTPREVITGERAEGLYEITAGLNAGDRVASSATFLLDSESRLQAALRGMAAPAPPAPPSPTANGSAPASTTSAIPAVPAPTAGPAPATRATDPSAHEGHHGHR